jgi:hypothetical protein
LPLIPVHDGHHYVHEDDVGLNFAGTLNSYLTVFRITNNLDFRLVIDQHFETISE